MSTYTRANTHALSHTYISACYMQVSDLLGRDGLHLEVLHRIRLRPHEVLEGKPLSPKGGCDTQ
jgi:hypothetical protein